MPIFEYACTNPDCDWTCEIFEPLDDPPRRCDLCDAVVERVPSAPGGRWRYMDGGGDAD